MILNKSVFEQFKSESDNAELVAKNLYGILFVDLISKVVTEKTISESEFTEYEIFSNEIFEGDSEDTIAIINKISEFRESEKYNGYIAWPTATLI